MLKSLSIQNFVIVDALEIQFEKGLCVLTGETGAGKSLILDAIAGILGQRIAADQIRQGAPYAYLEAVFELNPALQAFLQVHNFEELSDESTLTLSKTIQKSGSKSRLNGQLINQKLVRQLGLLLVDSISQHENQIIFQEEEHLSLLDALGSSTHQQFLTELREIFAQLKNREKQWADIQLRLQQNAREKDFLEFQLEEIDNAALVAEEEQALQQELNKLHHAEQLQQDINQAYYELYGSDQYPTLCERLETIQGWLSSAQNYDEALTALAETVDNALIQLQDVGRELRNYRDGLELDPFVLEEKTDRMDVIQRLKQKYGASVAEILAYAEEIRYRLQGMNQDESQIDLLAQEIAQLRQQYLEKAQALSASRKLLAHQLKPQIEAQLHDLGMTKTEFLAAVAQNPEVFSEKGQDQVQFLISPNPGEPLRPLSRTASGGEASRLLLALKMILNQSQPVSTLIFDEIDAGISGKAAVVVSQKLAQLATQYQVICISHLPVIAAIGQQQLWIEKYQESKRTTIAVFDLGREDRLEKLAQMTSGQITASSLKSAGEMMERAWQLHQALPSA